MFVIWFYLYNNSLWQPSPSSIPMRQPRGEKVTDILIESSYFLRNLIPSHLQIADFVILGGSMTDLSGIVK